MVALVGLTQDRSPAEEYGSDGNQAIAKYKAVIAKGQAKPRAQRSRKDADVWNALNTESFLERC